MKTNSESKSIFSLEIEYLRNELIECGIKNGLSHPTTVYLSQKLDKLLIELLSTKVLRFFKTEDTEKVTVPVQLGDEFSAFRRW